MNTLHTCAPGLEAATSDVVICCDCYVRALFLCLFGANILRHISVMLCDSCILSLIRCELFEGSEMKGSGCN